MTSAASVPEGPGLLLPGALIHDLRDAIAVAYDCASHAGSTIRIKRWNDVLARLNDEVAKHTALAAAPAPQGEALTDEEIYEAWLYRDCMEAIRAGDMRAQFINAVRAIEARITGQQPQGGARER
jgi:hypothetical protein